VLVDCETTLELEHAILTIMLFAGVENTDKQGGGVDGRQKNLTGGDSFCGVGGSYGGQRQPTMKGDDE
jgi:uncharacterized membrane protein YgcG